MNVSRGTGRRRGAIALAIVAVIAVSGYGAASVVAFDTYYREMAINPAWCGASASFKDATPASFETGTASTGPYVDTSPYLMPDYAAVSFPSRDPGVTIAGWWVQGSSPSAPAVILAHGRGRCRWDPEVLLPAGMLHRHGFSVLLIDLRNHGNSTIEPDPHTWAGATEYQDVLGAWDWVRSDRGIPAEAIGLYGVSLGAATAMVAMGAEPRVAATWEDSGPASMRLGIDERLSELHLPQFLDNGTIAVGRLLHGVDLDARSPLEAMTRLDGRPIAIVHGTADEVAPVEHARALVAAIRASGGSVDPWILPGVAHVRASFVVTAEYETRLAAFFSKAIGAPGP